MIVYEITLADGDVADTRYSIDGALDACAVESKRRATTVFLVARDGLERVIRCIYECGKRFDAKVCPSCKGESRKTGRWCNDCYGRGAVKVNQ